MTRFWMALALLTFPLAAEDTGIVAARMRIPPTAEILGSAVAPVTLVEFTDFQCPYCRKFHTDTFLVLRKKYIDTGKLRFTAHDFPLEFHSDAIQAAEAVRCAGDQKKYWPMRDLVSANADKLGRQGLATLAAQLSINAKAFATCLDTKRYEPAVRKEFMRAGMSGIRGTPSFILGVTTPEGVNGVLIPGSLGLEDFEKLIEKFAAVK